MNEDIFLTEMPGVEGRPGPRPVVKGENPLLQMELRSRYLRGELATVFFGKAIEALEEGEQDFLDRVRTLMTAQETDFFPNMKREEIRQLADALIQRAREAKLRVKPSTSARDQRGKAVA